MDGIGYDLMIFSPEGLANLALQEVATHQTSANLIPGVERSFFLKAKTTMWHHSLLSLGKYHGPENYGKKPVSCVAWLAIDPFTEPVYILDFQGGRDRRIHRNFFLVTTKLVVLGDNILPGKKVQVGHHFKNMV